MTILSQLFPSLKSTFIEETALIRSFILNCRRFAPISFSFCKYLYAKINKIFQSIFIHLFNNQ